MPALVQVHAGNRVLLFEGEFSEAALEEISIHDRVEDVIKTTSTKVSDLATTIRGCTDELLPALEDVAAEKRPGRSLSEAVVELGVTVTGEGNVVVAKGSVAANIKVTLTWDFT